METKLGCLLKMYLVRSINEPSCVADNGFPLRRRAAYERLLFDGKVDILQLVIDDLDDGAAELNKIQLAVNCWGVGERRGRDQHGLLKLIFGHRDGRAPDPAENPLRVLTVPARRLSDPGEDTLIPGAEFAVRIHCPHNTYAGKLWGSLRIIEAVGESPEFAPDLLKVDQVYHVIEYDAGVQKHP